MRKSVITVLHLAYWLLFIFLLAMVYFFMTLSPAFNEVGRSKSGGIQFWTKLMTGFALVPGFISFYVSYRWLFPVYLDKKRNLGFAGMSLLTALAAALVGALLESTPFLFGPSFLFAESYLSAISILLVMSLGCIIHIVLAAILRGFESWFGSLEVRETQKRKQVETELELVKSKLQPHFLFNTLNNIDTLVETKPETASVYIKSLSEILRYVLYHPKEGKVPLTEEIDHIENYIGLQRLRSSNPDYVRFTLNGRPDPHSTYPMLFIPYIENAFKHVGSRKTTASIDISFDCQFSDIRFRCINTFGKQDLPLYEMDKLTAVAAEQDNITDGRHEPSYRGLGNQLTRKRIELLYPGKHELNVEQGEDYYLVELWLHDTAS